MKRRLFIITLLFILLAGCSPAPKGPTESKSTQAAANRYLVYSRSGGIAGISNTWTIYADGRMKADDSRNFQATPEETSDLFDQIPLADFIEQGKSPQDQVCPDCFTVTLQYYDGNQSYELSLVPEKLDPDNPIRTWMDKIDALLTKASR